MKLPRVLLVVWIAFLARGTFYAAVVPIWEGVDEYAHFAYIQHLIHSRTLPTPRSMVSDEISRSLRLVPLPSRLDTWAPPTVIHDLYWELPEAERRTRQSALGSIPVEAQSGEGIDDLYEGKQPPLYYLFCAPLLKLSESASLPTRVLLLRLFTVLFTSLVVPLTFMIAVRVLEQESAAVIVAAFVSSMAVLMMNASRIGNDSLAMVLFSVLTLVLLRREPWKWDNAVLIGLLVGAGLLTKAYFVACIPVVGLSALLTLFRSRSPERPRVVAAVFSAGLIAALISAWWYLRVLGAEGPVWADIAPKSPVTLGSLPNMLFAMPWWQAVEGAFNLHFWFSGWSFLMVRSWIYAVLRWIFILSLLGSVIAMVRKGGTGLILWGFYGGFWLAMMYHAFVTYLSVGIPSFTGSYLFAVVSCEGVLLSSGVGLFLSTRARDRVMVALTGLFIALEVYATHFVLIPYYTGLIRYRADTSLMSFHVSQVIEIGLAEVVARLTINKAPFLNGGVMISLWAMFLTATACLFAAAWRAARRQT